MKQIILVVLVALFSANSFADSCTDALRAQKERDSIYSSNSGSDCYRANQRANAAENYMYQDINRQQQQRVERDHEILRDEQLRQSVRRQNGW